MTRFTVIALSALALFSSAAQAQRSERMERDPDRPSITEYSIKCDRGFYDDCPRPKPKRICIERYEDGRCADWSEPRIVCEWDGGFGNDCEPVKKPRKVCLDRVDGRCIEWEILD